MIKEKDELIEELTGGYEGDPSEAKRELARMDDLCHRAAEYIDSKLTEALDWYTEASERLNEATAYYEEDPFRVLNRININGHTENKNGLTYLSWAWAWQMLMELYPDSYTEINRPENGLPYWTDGKTCWVDVSVTIAWYDNISPELRTRTRGEVFPIMDHRNNSIPLEKLTSFNVNTALQRAWTKCIARHGLGFYIYAGEDLPKEEAEAKKADDESPCTEEQVQKVKNLYTEDELNTMLKRMKRKDITKVTKKEAQTMIDARDFSMVNAKTESF